jgi:hypothetical protein
VDLVIANLHLRFDFQGQAFTILSKVLDEEVKLLGMIKLLTKHVFVFALQHRIALQEFLKIQLLNVLELLPVEDDTIAVKELLNFNFLSCRCKIDDFVQNMRR